VSWPRQDFVGRANLDDSSQVHHRDSVCKPPHNVEVVRDKDVRASGFCLKLTQKLNNGVTNGKVERCGGLVEHDQFGTCCQSPRDHDSLLLTA
jgi:hypothetical protein